MTVVLLLQFDVLQNPVQTSRAFLAAAVPDTFSWSQPWSGFSLKEQLLP